VAYCQNPIIKNYEWGAFTLMFILTKFGHFYESKQNFIKLFLLNFASSYATFKENFNQNLKSYESNLIHGFITFVALALPEISDTEENIIFA